MVGKSGSGSGSAASPASGAIPLEGVASGAGRGDRLKARDVCTALAQILLGYSGHTLIACNSASVAGWGEGPRSLPLMSMREVARSARLPFCEGFTQTLNPTGNGKDSSCICPAQSCMSIVPPARQRSGLIFEAERLRGAGERWALDLLRPV